MSFGECENGRPLSRVAIAQNGATNGNDSFAISTQKDGDEPGEHRYVMIGNDYVGCQEQSDERRRKSPESVRSRDNRLHMCRSGGI